MTRPPKEGGLDKLQTTLTVLRGRGFPPPPHPAEESAAREDQAGEASASEGPGTA